MKIICDQSILNYGIQSVQRAVSTKNTLPVLSGIYLKAKSNTLTLCATDLDLAIECVIPVQVELPGEIILPARYFADLVRKAPAAVIDITVNPSNSTAKICSGLSEFTLHGYNAEEFPVIPGFIEETAILTIELASLKKAVQQTAFAISHDESRPIFTGQLFEIKDDGFNLIATDGYRLSFRKIKLATTAVKPANVIVPGKTLQELIRLFAMREDTETLTIGLTSNQIAFKLADVVVTSRLIEGQYPNYQQVIPKDLPLSLELKTNAFLAACERAALIAREGPGILKLDIRTEGKIIITSTSPEIGQTYEEFLITPPPDNLQIAFNARYLIDALKAIDTETAVFELTAPLRPTILRPRGQEEFLTVILPVKVV